MYTVAELKCVKRGKLHREDPNNHSKPVIEFVPRPDTYGIHPSNIAAKRALVAYFSPDLAECSDEHIKRCAKEYISGSMAHYKIVKAPVQLAA